MAASLGEGAQALPSPFSSGTPTRQPAHTHSPGVRRDLSAAPISQPPSEIPPAQHFRRQGAVRLVHHSFHRGGRRARTPSSGCSPSPPRGLPQPCCLQKPCSVLRVTALTPLHGQEPGAQAHTPCFPGPRGYCRNEVPSRGPSPHRAGTGCPSPGPS